MLELWPNDVVMGTMQRLAFPEDDCALLEDEKLALSLFTFSCPRPCLLAWTNDGILFHSLPFAALLLYVKHAFVHVEKLREVYIFTCRVCKYLPHVDLESLGVSFNA